MTSRAQNIRLSRTAAAIAPDVEPIPFLCECDDEECGASVGLTSAEYAAFGDLLNFTAPGHVIARADRTGSTPRFELYLAAKA